MSRPPTSLVIVSRARPHDLALCLTGCAQLHHPALEIVVVADEAGRAAVQAHALASQVKLIACDEANISRARNLGLAASAGEVVAFLDDDAVPEPLWLFHLTDPFRDPEVAAATGYTLAGDGLRFQSRAAVALADGQTVPVPLAGQAPVAWRGRPGRGIKTEGTNMAFRRDVLIALGGFDERFRFYLDETDVDLRLAAGGKVTAIVPLAQVHHRRAPSAQRAQTRAPRDLFDVGASLAVFLRKHTPAADRARLSAAERQRQRRRLLAAMVAGALDPRDVGRLLLRFDEGLKCGGKTVLEQIVDLSLPPPEWRPLGAMDFVPVRLEGRLWAARSHRESAARHPNRPLTLYLFSRTALFHRVRFRPEGYWEQRGGLFGRARPEDPLFRLWRVRARAAQEARQSAACRGRC